MRPHGCSVDGKPVANRTIPHTIPFVETIYATFDVGVGTRTGVDDNDYKPPFRFSVKIDKLTVKLVPLKAAEEKLLQQKAQETKNKGAVITPFFCEMRHVRYF